MGGATAAQPASSSNAPKVRINIRPVERGRLALVVVPGLRAGVGREGREQGKRSGGGGPPDLHQPLRTQMKLPLSQAFSAALAHALMTQPSSSLFMWPSLAFVFL